MSDPKSSGILNSSFAFVESDIKSIINSLSRNKAAGEDGLTAEAYVFGGPVVSVLMEFFNLILELQISPSQWNHSLDF